MQVTYNVAVTDSAGAVDTQTVTITSRTTTCGRHRGAGNRGRQPERCGAGAQSRDQRRLRDRQFQRLERRSAQRWTSCSFAGCGPVWGLLTGVTDPRSLSQHIVTTAGTTYQITFFAARVSIRPGSILTTSMERNAGRDPRFPLRPRFYRIYLHGDATSSDTVLASNIATTQMCSSTMSVTATSVQRSRPARSASPMPT